MKTPRKTQQLLLLVLAIVFSIALMFSFTELPRLLDQILQKNVGFPGMDHGRDAISAYKTEVYIDSLYLRWIGYGSLLLVVAFIVIGFFTKRTGWAWLGAFTIFLPVFGQFAMSMFFLAGLGMLRVGWLPFWDINFQVLELGNVIYVPHWIVMWIFEQFNYWATPLLAWTYMGVGAFLFMWGVLVWMQSHFIQKGVATSWIYKISRHPQYLGWIIWSYGLVIYSPLVNQMKKSWGMPASLPWLLMTMVIIGICLLEELKMKEKYGNSYTEYAKQTPFLIPLPGWFRRAIRYPIYIIIGKKEIRRKRDVLKIVGISTLVFILLSSIWVEMGTTRTFPILKSKRIKAVNELVEDLSNKDLNWRIRYRKFHTLSRYGDLAKPAMIEFLNSDIAINQIKSVEFMGDFGSSSEASLLYHLIDHPDENVRTATFYALADLQDTNAIPLLMDQLMLETKGFPKTCIYYSLAQLNASEAWDLITETSAHDESWVRMAAVKAMADLDSKKVIPYLLPMFEEESDWVKEDATATAYKVNCKECLPYLKAQLENEHYEIRYFSKLAIERIESLDNN